MSRGWGEPDRPLVDIVDSLSDGSFLSLLSAVTHRDESHIRVTRLSWVLRRDPLQLLHVANQLRRRLLLYVHFPRGI